jgi:hypothetical protein
MSSAPVGLDVREYRYQYWYFKVPDAASYFATTSNQWLITKIQFFAGAAPGLFALSDTPSPPIPVVAGGCVTLEPNGGYRGDILQIAGQDAVIIIEFWIQVNETGPIAVTIL